MQNKEELIKYLHNRDDDRLVIPCDCKDLAHIVHFEITKDGGFDTYEGNIQLFLNRQPSIFKRLIIGLEYIFNIKKLTGRAGWYQIDNTLMNQYQLEKLRDFITEKLKSNGNI